VARGEVSGVARRLEDNEPSSQIRRNRGREVGIGQSDDLVEVRVRGRLYGW